MNERKVRSDDQGTYYGTSGVVHYNCIHATNHKMEILKDVELCGEISLEKLTPRIISVLLALLQYELIAKLEPISDEAIAEIVDNINKTILRSWAS